MGKVISLKKCLEQPVNEKDLGSWKTWNLRHSSSLRPKLDIIFFELEVLGVVCSNEHFHFCSYDQQLTVVEDHKTCICVIKLKRANKTKYAN